MFSSMQLRCRVSLLIVLIFFFYIAVYLQNFAKSRSLGCILIFKSTSPGRFWFTVCSGLTLYCLQFRILIADHQKKIYAFLVLFVYSKILTYCRLSQRWCRIYQHPLLGTLIKAELSLLKMYAVSNYVALPLKILWVTDMRILTSQYLF